MSQLMLPPKLTTLFKIPLFLGQNMYDDSAIPKNLDFLSGTKITVKKLKSCQFFAIFANFTIEHCDYRIAHTVFIFSGVVRIMKTPFFVF